jgi:proline iminopeptidase
MNENNPNNGRYIDLEDTRLFIVEKGEGFPLLILHGGPGMDHHMFGDYLDALAKEFLLIFVDQRSQGKSDESPSETWTLKQMAKDVRSLAEALKLDQYAVLGHSYGAFVALQNAIDFPGSASKTIISSGIPSARFLSHVEKSISEFTPVEMRDKITASWEKEKTVKTKEEVAQLLEDQMPFHFKDPRNPIIKEFYKKSANSNYSPGVLSYFANQEYGGIEVEEKLSLITQPTLVLAGRYDRVCSVEAAQVIKKGIPNSSLTIFEKSAHMTFIEENELYLDTVKQFLEKSD